MADWLVLLHIGTKTEKRKVDEAFSCSSLGGCSKPLALFLHQPSISSTLSNTVSTL